MVASLVFAKSAYPETGVGIRVLLKKKIPNIMSLFYVLVTPNIMVFFLSIMGPFYIHQIPNIMGLFYVKRPIVSYGSFLCTAPPTLHKKDP